MAHTGLRRAGPNRRCGFSMVELMIALVVGLFLLGGIVQLLVSSRISYRVGEQVSRIQENGRYGVNMFAERARGTLSMGCRNTMMEIPLDGLSVGGDSLISVGCLLRNDATNCTGDPVVRADAALGYDSTEQGGANWLKDMPNGSNNLVADRWLRGDVLIVWGAEGAGSYVKGFDKNDAEPPEVVGISLVNDNQELGTGNEAALITNCEQSHLLDIVSSDRQDLELGAGTIEKLQANSYIPEGITVSDENPLNRAVVYPFSYEAYFICCVDTGDDDTDWSLISDAPRDKCTGDSDRYLPSLCRWQSAGGSEETRRGRTDALITGIADMRVTYSGDTDDDGDVDFHASDSGSDPVPTAAWVTSQDYWSKVVGAQIELLVTSVEQVDQLGTRGVARFGGEARAPIDLRWPPNDSGASAPHVDTLGYDLRTLTGNRRLFERYVISAAFRARARWYIE